MMHKGTRVAWTLRDGTPGEGVTISDEEDGHVLVATTGEREFSPVAWCVVMWLREAVPHPSTSPGIPG